jgi:hypothetical protein
MIAAAENLAPADLRRTFACTRSPSASRALISAPRGCGAVASRASVKVWKADSNGQATEERALM